MDSLATVLFPGYRRKVLALLLLHPERSLHLREIARMTGTVPGTLARELRQLDAAGILRRERVGNQVRFTASRDCPVFEELAAILRKTTGLADVLVEALAPVAGQIEQAFVFGSMARGDAGPNSDVDVMLIGSVRYEDALAALQPTESLLGREVNPSVFTSEEWRERMRRKDPFALEVLARPRLFLIGGKDEPEESRG